MEHHALPTATVGPSKKSRCAMSRSPFPRARMALRQADVAITGRAGLRTPTNERTPRMPESTSPTPMPQLVDIPAVAKTPGVDARHVRRLVYERRIPFIKWGHLIRFDPDEIR